MQCNAHFCCLGKTGIQFAGGHLKEIQKAMKNPMANLGVILKEGSSRLRRQVGLDVPNLSEYVHPDFKEEAALLGKNIVAFNAAVEHLLIKHTKSIVHEQMLLHRLANAAIDIYTMLVVMSRATRGLQKNVPSAEIEKNMTKVICSEANINIDRTLKSIRNTEALKNDEVMRVIAREVLQNGGLVHGHPLD